MTGRLRACPRCGHVDTTSAFARVDQGGSPQHCATRRRCPRCGAELRAWAFAIIQRSAERRP